MSKYDDKYEGPGREADGSQVRGIIRQQLDEKPSKEKSREVVVRPDGTKVIRVTKKRRVMVSEADKKKAGRRSFLLIVAGACAVCFLMMGVLLFRMSVMGGDSYVSQYENKLKEAWGAERVTLTGQGLNGAEFHLSHITAEFPETSPVQRVELTDITADVDFMSYFTRVLTGDKMVIARAEIDLNPKIRTMQMPCYQGADMWHFRRFECANLQVRMGAGKEEVFTVQNAHAYMYYPRQVDRSSLAMSFSGGTIQLRGMQLIRSGEAKFQITAKGIEEFSVSGTTDAANLPAGQEHSSFTITGRLPEGAAYEGPYEFDSQNMNWVDFTQGRFGRLLTAKTQRQAMNGEHSQAFIALPFDTPAPLFSGEFLLKNICVNGLPVQLMLLEHMESDKRKLYQPATVSLGHLRLSHEGETMTVDFPENRVTERDLIAMHGSMSLNRNNELGGVLNFGIPTLLTHAEYADGKSDPLFTENAGMAWMKVALSGTVNLPGDDSARLNAEAQEARASRPGRLKLDAVDFDKISKQLEKERETLRQAEQGTAPDAGNDETGHRETLPNWDSGSLDMSSPLDRKGIFD